MGAEQQTIPAKRSRSPGLSQWSALTGRCRQYSGPTRTSIVNGGFRAAVTQRWKFRESNQSRPDIRAYVLNDRTWPTADGPRAGRDRPQTLQSGLRKTVMWTSPVRRCVNPPGHPPHPHCKHRMLIVPA
jgi:hypothetical protein